MFSATPKKLIADQLYSRFYGDIHTYIHRANSERDRHPLKCVEETPPKKIGPDYFTYNARNENAVKNLSPWQKFCRSSVRGEKGDASPFSKFLELWSTMVRATRETTKKKRPARHRLARSPYLRLDSPWTYSPLPREGGREMAGSFFPLN